MKIREKLGEKLDRRFSKVIDAELTKKFGDCKFATHYNLFAMSLQTSWDEKLPTRKKKEIKSFSEGFSIGYGNAMMFIKNGND